MKFSEENLQIEKGKGDAPSRKKPFFSINSELRNYLKTHGREVKLPVAYRDLANITYSVPLKDKYGKDTAWERVIYDMHQWNFIREGLLKIYAILKTEGDYSFSAHLDVARIDYCAFGNSNPFRIRIVNKYNDNYDHFYIKTADSSRIYGLELEHILSPNRITYFTHFNTLVEEHIPGIPGDIFVNQYLNQESTNIVRLAKEFVKFNERCFIRLLGDMRSYNFVVNITPDIEDFQYRIRAIDFDQQSYEGRKNLYLPQFFKENLDMVNLCLDNLDKISIEQYQIEEKTLIAFRVATSRRRIIQLLNIMCKDDISSPEKTAQLAAELAEFTGNPRFLKCKTMGEIVKYNLKESLGKILRQIMEAKGNISG